MKKADRLIEAIKADPASADDGLLANDLLREFQMGYPIENLRSLLSSRDDRIVRTGAFIASELGNSAVPLLADVTRLLTHPTRTVRADAICSVLTCSTGKDEDAIASVVAMLDD